MCSCGSACGAGRMPFYPDYQPPSFQLLRSIDYPELDKVLCVYPAAQTTDTQAAIPFRVRTPNVRMRTRVSLALVPIDASLDTDTRPNTDILGGTGTLWGAIVQTVRDNTRKMVPIRDLVGTKTGPQAIPVDAGLWGFDWQGETAGDELYFSFVPPNAKAGNTTAAAWHVIVSYEAVHRLTDQEWQRFRQEYRLDAPQPKVLG